MQHLVKVLVAIAVLSISSFSSAYVISGGAYNGTDVGGLDTRIDSVTQPDSSGNQDELDWANTFISPDTTFANSEATHRQSNVVYYATNSVGIYALKLNWLPDYFIVKNGNFHALFENNSALGWAVFDVSLFDSKMNIGKNGRVGDPISHVSEYGASEPPCQSPTQPGCEPPQVPEPATLGLLGLGLIGLAATRRRLI